MVDDWLDENDIREARVHLDDRRYTLGRRSLGSYHHPETPLGSHQTQ